MNFDKVIRCDNNSKKAFVLLAEDIGFYPALDSVLDRLLPRDLEEIEVAINSQGGDYFVGLGIYNFLSRHPARVTTVVTGVASSIASVIFLAGDRRQMAKNSMLMIHRPSAGMHGDSDDLSKRAELLRILERQLLDIYEERSGLARDDLSEKMAAETWFTAEDALAAGFVDEIVDPVAIAACGDRADALKAWENAPQKLIDAFSDSPEIPLINRGEHEEAKAVFDLEVAAAFSV